ncbi:hypothetical protein ACFFRR_006781 [Megaselia abdita]
MRSGILIAFLGILFAKQSFCLKKGNVPYSSSFAGQYFSEAGTYNFLFPRDAAFVASYTLTSLENALGNAGKHEAKFLPERKKLERNLNEIYKICKKNRAQFLPYKTSPVPESQLKSDIDKALKDSDVILSELVAFTFKNYTDTFGIKEKMNKTYPYNNGNDYLYPKHVQDVEIAKKYLNFKFALNKISDNAAVIVVEMEVPVLDKFNLYRIFYIPRDNSKTSKIEFIKDQSLSNFAYIERMWPRELILIKNIDSCELTNDTFFCDPMKTTNVQDKESSCTTLIFFSECYQEQNNACRLLEKKCTFEESSSHKEFTYVGDNKFYVFLTREANYIYECDDGRREEGKFMFESLKDHHYFGTVDIEENCVLRTAHISLFNKNGFSETQIIDDEELIWADVPKIIGVPKWVFYVSVAAISLIIVMILITWICICVRRCKNEKVREYTNVITSD